MKKLISYILIIIFFAVSCKNSSQNKGNKKQINIATNLPLTGDFAVYGEAIKAGASFALKDLKNEKYEFVLDWQDNNSKAKTAVTIFNKHKIDNFDIYISGIKPQTMSIIDQFSNINKPHFVWVFDAYITRDYNNTFRTWVNYKYEPEYYLKYIDKVKPERIAIIYVQLPHTDEEFNNILIPQIKKRNISDILVEPYFYDKNDFKDIVTKVKSFNPELLIINGFKGNLIQLIKSLRENDLIKNKNTICTYDLLDAASDLSQNMLEGIRVVIPQFETRKNEKLQKWQEDFYNFYNRHPRYTDAYAYDMIKIIEFAYLNLENYSNISESILNTKFEGITGNIEFDKTGDLILNLDIGYFSNGVLKFED